MQKLKKSIYWTFFLLAPLIIHASESFIEKADLAKKRANLAFSQTGGGPEYHRALITAYCVWRQLSFPVDDNYLCRLIPFGIAS